MSTPAEELNFGDPFKFDMSALADQTLAQAQPRLAALGAPSAQRPAAVRPAAAPKPAAAPAQPTTEQMLDESMRKEAALYEKQASYAVDPEEMLKARRDYSAAETRNLEQLQKRQSELADMLDPRKIVKQEAPKYQDFAKQVSPFATMLMAIGGKAFGLSGQNMLGALTGMVQGTSEGNIQNYNAAYKQWQDSVAQANEQHQQLEKWVAQLSEQAKDNAILQNQYAKQALEAFGARQEIADTGLNGLQGLRKTMAEVNKAKDKSEIDRLRLTMASDRLEYQRQRDFTKIMGGINSQIEATDRLDKATSRIEEKWKALEDAAKTDPELRSLINAGAALDSKVLQRLTPISKKAVSDFNTAAASSVGPLLREVNQGLPASAFRGVKVEYREMDTIPTLDKGWNQAKSAIESMRYRVNESQKEAAKKRNETITSYQQTGIPFSMKITPEEGESSSQTSAKPVGAPEDAKLASDGKWYSPDPNRLGKYLRWD